MERGSEPEVAEAVVEAEVAEVAEVEAEAAEVAAVVVAVVEVVEEEEVEAVSSIARSGRPRHRPSPRTQTHRNRLPVPRRFHRRGSTRC